ncbi:MAG: hypothetical protein K0R38_2538 [Polyangiaceae bacterium]|jgi:hypothetical protein|nr:hypothetical protein [Polyangiaceae bacterium]
MSIEPEDLLEEALRGDLPSKDAETRVRRRLLAAGLAVGNGVAATTAAASGAAATGATASAGAIAKLATLSWGLKVGLAAAVTIPSAGLLWEHHQRGSAAEVAATTAATGGADATTEPATAPPLPKIDPPASAPPATPAPATEASRTRAAVRREEPSPPVATPPAALAPSRHEFAASEPPRDRDPPAAGTTLSEETKLLDRAFAALSAGNRDAARRLVAEHESRYPQGLLMKERERAKNKLSELSRGE